MALNELTNKIVGDANERAERIRAEAASSTAAAERERAVHAEAQRAQYRAETERMVADRAVRAHAQVEAEARGVLESARRSLLDTTFSQALDRALTADSVAYTALLAAPFAQLAQTGVTVSRLYAPEARAAETERAARAAGVTAPVEARNDIQGGFVAVADECEYDARFEHTLAHLKRRHESEIAHMLFEA